MLIDNYSIAELEAALERKKRARAPQPLNFKNYSKLEEAAVSHIENRVKGIYEDKQWIFEAALETVYGEDIWDWYNSIELDD